MGCNDKMEQWSKVKEMIKNSGRITVLTGAGISTESGIPDFRSTDGIWRQKSQISLSREELMSLSYLRRQPEHFWDFYKEIFQVKLQNDYEPNHSHYYLAELERSKKEVNIFTQNVDGLHQKAGSQFVFEVHGNIKGATCPKCGAKYDEHYVNEHEFPVCHNVIYKENICNSYIVVNHFKHKDFVRCDDCGEKHPIDEHTTSIRCKNKKKNTLRCTHYLKPNVVLFDDNIKHYNEAVYHLRNSDVFLVIGTSLKVYPINGLVHEATRFPQLSKIYINRDASDMDHLFDYCLKGELKDIIEFLIEK